MNNDVTTIDLFAPDFDFRSISKEVFKRAYHIAVRENQNDPEKLVYLNLLNEQVKRYYRNNNPDVIINPSDVNTGHNNDTPGNGNSNVDNDNVHNDYNDQYIPGTNILKPRSRGIFESDEDYVEFLRNYYEENLRVQYNLIDKMSNSNKNSEDFIKDALHGPIESGMDKQVPIPVAPEPKQVPIPTQPEVNDPVIDLPKPVPPVPTQPEIVQSNSELPGPVEPQPVLPTINDEPKKGLITIINELTTGLEIKKNTGKRYTASNVKVARQFKDELHSGNVIYNIVHIAPSIVKSAATFANKMLGKLTLSRKQRDNMIILRDRIDSMSDEDLMTVYNEYRGSRVIQERFPSAINLLLQDRVSRFTLDNLTRLNDENMNGYNEIFATYEQVNSINEMLKESNLTQQQIDSLNHRKEQLLSGKIELIQKIRDNYVEANQWMSGGEHGFSEDMKAAATKLSITGKRFAKDHNLDNDLLEKEAFLEQAENRAIAAGDPESALAAFVGMEQLLSKETNIKKSVFGNRSTGKKYYSPLAKQLDYRDDPFIKDVFTTMAVVGAGVSAYNAMKTHGAQADDILRQQQEEASQVNSANNATMSQVNQTGQDIVNKRGDFTEGMQAQQQMDINNYAMTRERQSLDDNSWILSSDSYHQADALSHSAVDDLYTNVENQIKAITNKYTSGSLSQVEAMEAISKVSQQTQASFQELISGYLPSLNEYASTHPQFDLNGVMESLRYMQQNPDAIVNMNQAMIDTTNMGESLIGLSAAQMRALESLPSDMKTTIFGAATAGALAYKVATSTQRGKRNRKYGDEVTRMVEESMQNENTMTNTQQNVL